MSPWPGKYVIGLTGNIAAGKSVVRRMLEHLGAFGIDADALGHLAIAKGAPGYKPVVSYFGEYILDEFGQIDRPRLGRIVFSDPEALLKLERIIHPLVRHAIDMFIRRTNKKVIVIEAIKLLEGDLFKSCDKIWVTHAPVKVRLDRLVEKRKMSEGEAQQRIASQAHPNDKLSVADVVIRNDKSFENMWSQVSAEWEAIHPADDDTAPYQVFTGMEQLAVQRARPSQAEQIASLVKSISLGKKQMTRSEVMAEFGEKAFLLLFRGQQPVGLLGWQVENLVTRTTDFYLEKNVPVGAAAEHLIAQVEETSRELQSEASLLFLPKQLAAKDEIWRNLGYEKKSIEALSIRAWQEAARESYVPGTEMYFKQLRVDRVLRPI